MEDSVKKWFAVDVVCDPAATEAIESAFNELGALGTEIDSLRKPPGQPLRVSAYFETLPDEADIGTTVNESLRIYGHTAGAVKGIENHAVVQTDWLAEWKKHWQPTEIGKFVIAPPWESVAASDKIVITIEPNMAFGTGTHETTQLCLAAIGDLYDPDLTFLDVGTGTGILAIAAAKLGGAKIVACDTDADSVKIARENAVLNGTGDPIEFFDGSIDERTSVFDFVCANLTIDVILPLLDLLLAKTRRILLLSGILADQETMIVDALGSRCIADLEVGRAGEWISVRVRVG